MTGQVSNPQDYYPLVDVLIPPSAFEGVPVTIIESQIAGVPCVVSNVINPDVVISNACHFIDVNANYDLFMRMYTAGYKGYNIQEKLYKYRIINGDKKYRPMKDRVNETVTRCKGFKSLGLLGGEYSVCCETGNNRTYSPEVIQEDKAETVRGLVSVIMPVYNTQEELLKAAVNSVLMQSYRELELIIVDDGSEKSCAMLCDKLAAQDGKVNVIHIMNAGASTARNYGIEESQGEYIAFIDSDDTMAVNLLQEFINQIGDVDFVVCGCEHVQTIQSGEYAKVNGRKTLNRKECIECLCYMNPPYDHIETNAIWGKLYRRSLMDNIRFDSSLIMAEDFIFNFNYILGACAGKYLDFQGYNYYEHSDSISRSYKPAMMKTINTTEQLVQDYKESDVFDALLSRCVNIAFTILMMVPCELREDQSRIQKFINFYRIEVFLNQYTKRKVKLAILSSFLGYGITRRLFLIKRRL